MNIIGMDIGGANIKLADLHQRAVTVPFPLWKAPAQLEQQVRQAMQPFLPCEGIAVTMTGELADCYPHKSTGVEHIVRAVVQAAGEKPVWIWQTAGEFVEAETAIEFFELTAAANWHALATWGARAAVTGAGLLIDMGSTTVDIIPLKGGLPHTQGSTDFTRLQAGELVYTGAKRTPLMAVTSHVELDGVRVPLAAEYFATMQDVYLLADQLPEQPDDCDTADGRPADKQHARQRLARIVCCDAEELGEERLMQMQRQIIQAQHQQIRQSLRQVLEHMGELPQILLLSGSAQGIVEQVLTTLPELQGVEKISLHARLGPAIASAACAYAVAQLASEQQSAF